MKQSALAAGLLLAGLVASSPALANYAVIHFDDGSCKVWWDSADNPWGSGWTKIAIALPDHMAAQAALDTAISQRVCR